MRLLIIISVSIIFITYENSKLKYINRQPKVAIQPFEGFPRDLIQPIKSRINSMYKVETENDIRHGFSRITRIFYIGFANNFYNINRVN